MGYAGWSAGQLEQEIAQNAWLTVEADAEVLFDTPVEARLPAAMRLLGIDFSRLSDSAAARRSGRRIVLAFDFGTRKIGVAVGNTLVRVAHPLTTIRGEARAPRFAAIGALVAQWQPQALVVGRPVHADGTPHEVTAQADRFARSLEGRFGLPVMRVDERYTTRGRRPRAARGGRARRSARESRDAVAAQLILQSWLDEEERRAP